MAYATPNAPRMESSAKSVGTPTKNFNILIDAVILKMYILTLYYTSSSDFNPYYVPSVQ